MVLKSGFCQIPMYNFFIQLFNNNLTIQKLQNEILSLLTNGKKKTNIT